MSSRPQAAKPKSLLPKEHGAYAELAYPLVTAVLIGQARLAAWCLIGGTVLAFLAHEPMLVLLGSRGQRARTEMARPARSRLLTMGPASLLLGATGLYLAPDSARWSAIAPAALALVVLVFVLKKQEKTLMGEATVAAAFSSALLPVALSSSVAWPQALLAALVWFASFLLGTVTVRATVAHFKTGDRKVTILPLSLGAATALTAVCFSGIIGLGSAAAGLGALAALPTALMAIVFAVKPLHPKRLRLLGWSLVAVQTTTLAWLAVML